MLNNLPDAKWLDAIRLPAKITAGLLLFTLILLLFSYWGIIPLAGGWKIIVIVLALLFGSLSFANFSEVTFKFLKDAITAWRYKTKVIAKLDYLPKEEVYYLAECLRDNTPSFTGYCFNPHISSLMSKGLACTPGGTYHQDHHPFYIEDFVWKAPLKRKEEFIEKDRQLNRER